MSNTAEKDWEWQAQREFNRRWDCGQYWDRRTIEYKRLRQGFISGFMAAHGVVTESSNPVVPGREE